MKNLKTIDTEGWTDIETLEAFRSLCERVQIAPEVVGGAILIHLICGEYVVTSAPIPIDDYIKAETIQ